MKAFQIMVLMLLCIFLLCGPAFADEGSFADVPPDADYAEAVDELVALGIITGYEDNTFRPDNTITRAEVAAMVCRLLGMEEEAKTMTEQVFPDVPSSHWAVGYVAMAKELGFIKGFEDGSFRAGDPVTYEQIVKMLVSARGYEDFAIEEGGWPQGYLYMAKSIGLVDAHPATTNLPSPRSTVAELFYRAIYVSEFIEYDSE